MAAFAPIQPLAAQAAPQRRAGGARPTPRRQPRPAGVTVLAREAAAFGGLVYIGVRFTGALIGHSVAHVLSGSSSRFVGPL